MSKFKHIVSKTKKMQFGGLISGLAGGLTGDLFGQGLPNNAYNYQDTGHRSTSYDGIQYIPQATQPNIMPQLLEAYNSKYKVKDFYDPTKHKIDTGDLEKNIDARNYDKETFRSRLADIQKQAEEYITLNRRDADKMAMFDIWASQKKNEVMKDMQAAVNLKKTDVGATDIIQKSGRMSDVMADAKGNPLFIVRDKKGVEDYVTEEQLQVLMEKDKDEELTVEILPFSSGLRQFEINKRFADDAGTMINTDTRNITDAEKSLNEFYNTTGYKLIKTSLSQVPQVTTKDYGYDKLIQTQWMEGSTESKENKEKILEAKKQITENIPSEILIPLKKAFATQLSRNGFREKKAILETKVNPKTGQSQEVVTGFETGKKRMTLSQQNLAFTNYVQDFINRNADKKEIDEKKTETSFKNNQTLQSNGSDLALAERKRKEEASIGETLASQQGKTTPIQIQDLFSKDGTGLDWIAGVTGFLHTGIGETLTAFNQSESAKRLNIGRSWNKNGKRINEITDGKTRESYTEFMNKSGAVEPRMAYAMMPLDKKGDIVTDNKVLLNFKSLYDKAEGIKQSNLSEQDKRKSLDKIQSQIENLNIGSWQPGYWTTQYSIPNEKGGMLGNYEGTIGITGSKKVDNISAKRIRTQMGLKEDATNSVYETPVFTATTNMAQSQIYDAKNLNTSKVATKGVGTTGEVYSQEQGGKLMQSGGLLEELENNRISFTDLTLDDLY